MTDTVTIAGSNLYSGTYTEDAFWVLGGANNGGHDDTDALTGNEAFVFGNLQYKNSVTTDKSYDGSGTEFSGAANTSYQVTGSGTSDDTLHFSFTLHPGTPGVTSNFLTTYAPQDYASDASGAATNGFPTGDGDADLQSHQSVSGWDSQYLAWVNSLTGGSYASISAAEQAATSAGFTFSDTTTVETGVHNNDPDNAQPYNVIATAQGTDPTLTADHGGVKTLVGFAVGSDHIALDGVADEATFEQYFNVSSTATHLSANNNTVHDTTVSLGDGSSWSVDLLGVDTSAMSGQALTDYVWNNIIAH